MRAFAQSIVETVRHPLLVLDGKMRLCKANAVFYRTFQFVEAETEGRVLYELGPPWEFPRLRALIEGILAHGFLEDFEIEHHLAHRGRRVFLISGRRLSRDEEIEPMVLLAVEDVTETRQAQAELRRLNADLERRVRERTGELAATIQELEAFSYSVSHDLRAPLRAIDGFSDELLRSHSAQLDDKGKHYLQRIRAGTQRMAQLIDDMLQLSRLSRGEMRREAVDLSTLAAAIAAELRQQEPARNVTFVIEPDMQAVGDASLLRVVLENLLGNAWKFTSKRPTATIRFGRGAHDGRREFFVRDDGAGFDMNHAGKLFGAFQRLHPEREFPGTGIGLATVQRVVRRHGGQVRAEGTPNEGAAFYFTLPQEPAA